jgi:hypothetical protein
MKKVMIVTAILLLACSGLAFADSTAPALANKGLTIYGVDTGTATTDDTLIGKLSSGVYAGWNTASGGYAILTTHERGSQSYGTAYDSTGIYRKSGQVTTAPGTTGSDAFGSGWSQL